ncbi:MAG: gliding motility-associated C-terminal domain-containing protein [Flavobacteriales bacterium]|nr:gliding motility-associated C-terminal domain-containing protein [Flavobacteriales bacterium]
MKRTIAEHFKILLLSALSVVYCQLSISQDVPEFIMSDTTISVCEGILYDSGGPDDIYGNSENLTTVINPGGVITITFFNSFCLENNLDFVYVYDGPNDTYPLLGVFTDNNLPPTLVANSGAVTVVLISDNNVAYCGFAMQWDSDLPEPIPPIIAVDPVPSCNSSLVQINFSYPVACWWLDLDEFEVTLTSNGNNITIEEITPACVGDSANYVWLTLEAPLTINCPYYIEMVIPIADNCGLIYIFTIFTSIDFFECPVSASIEADDNTLCPGDCATLNAIVEGCLNYTFAWSNGLPPTSGPHIVCPLISTNYSVTVTETESGSTSVETITVFVESTSIITLDFTTCQSGNDVQLIAESQGEWSGPGIVDEENGWFDPDQALGGDNLIYFASDGCLDSMTITILPIQTDNIIAACPGSVPFQLNATPAGGVWTGPNTTPGGIFDPSTIGSFNLTYSLGSCTDPLTVNVANITGIYDLDTLCQSVWADTIEFSPLGGVWSGPGIENSFLGIFVPLNAPPGDVVLTYDIQGCSEIFNAYVLEIYLDESHSACPEEDPLVWNDPPTPPGGYWEGDGIINPVTGLYDPSLFPNDSYTYITYHAPNGCVDTTFIYNLQTVIAVEELFFCISDDPFDLHDGNVGNAPGNNGIWSGTGVEEIYDGVWIFSPTLAAVGEHMVYYEKNNCTDSMTVVVFPDDLSVESFSFCSDEDALQLDPNLQPGGTWSGNGITDALNGTFDPALADEGNSELIWITPPGCTDTVFIFVEEFQQAAIMELGTVYCFADTIIEFEVEPAGGIITGANSDFTFNPAVGGEGLHEVIYVWTGIECASSDTLLITVYPPIETEIALSDSAICLGETSTISVTASGGNPNFVLQYDWSDDNPGFTTNTVAPQETTTFYVLTFDGCSDPVLDSVVIEILPPILVNAVTSDTVCFGENGFATAQVLNTGDFSVEWNEEMTDSVFDVAGSLHELHVLDLLNGCEFDTLVLIPSYSPITANFSINPNEDCVDWMDAENITFIDLSQNAQGGTWTFGNGNTEEYLEGVNPQQTYESAGEFFVSLMVVNEGNCPDSAMGTVCILPPTPIFIPDIFSPNGDGNNDVLYVRSQGILAMQFIVYNRWGEKVFSSDKVDHGWDGNQQGKPAPTDVYMYYFKANMNDGSVQEMKGDITLIR